MLSVDKIEKIPPGDVSIPDRLRHMNEDRVNDMMESFTKMGQMTPIQTRIVGDGEDVILVAGRHRLEAAIRLGWQYISMTFVYGTADEFRLWEIAENLHRSELDTLERSEHIAEWVRLTTVNEVSGQDVPKLSARGRKGEGRPESGVAKASRELPVAGETPEAKKKSVQRSLKIDAISPEAKQAARQAGLGKNQSALLKVAAAPKEEQVTVVERIMIEKAERAEARAAPEPEPEPEPASDLTAEFADYVIAHIAEDDIPGLLAFMEKMTAEEMVGALRQVVG